MVKPIDGVMYANGLESCLMGHATQATPTGVQTVAVYSVEKIINLLADNSAEADAANGTDVAEREQYLNEAEEFFSHNIECAFVGLTPTVHPVFYREPVEGLDD